MKRVRGACMHSPSCSFSEVISWICSLLLFTWNGTEESVCMGAKIWLLKSVHTQLLSLRNLYILENLALLSFALRRICYDESHHVAYLFLKSFTSVVSFSSIQAGFKHWNWLSLNFASIYMGYGRGFNSTSHLRCKKFVPNQLVGDSRRLRLSDLSIVMSTIIAVSSRLLMIQTGLCNVAVICVFFVVYECVSLGHCFSCFLCAGISLAFRGQVLSHTRCLNEFDSVLKKKINWMCEIPNPLIWLP